ncbi:uncharacterized protein [Amphiura filiformis]|uniref:uncharacterized protein n=1 Tax=Amphiura filiformis TaxID=82378 RepID=UPI003B2137CE
MEQKGHTPCPDITCTNCNTPDQKATVRCIDCKENLCQKCYASHMTLKVMKNHRIVTMTDIYSGKVNLLATEGNVCKAHKEPYKYFCTSENKLICQDCVILKECPTEHDRVTLETAAQVQLEELGGFIKESTDILMKYKETVQETEIVGKELEIHSQIAKESVAIAEQKCADLLWQTAQTIKDEIDKIKLQRIKTLDENKATLESTIRNIEKINKDTSRMITSGSTMEVISSHVTLSEKLKKLLQCPPCETDKALSNITFKVAIPASISIGQLFTTGTPETTWKLVGQFSTAEFDQLYGLDVTQDGDIAVCSWRQGVKVFTRSGEVLHTLYRYTGAMDVAVTHDNKYLSIPIKERLIIVNGRYGTRLQTVPIIDENNMVSQGNSVTVDQKGKVIVGNVSNSISIYNSELNQVSTFPTQARVRHLAATSNGDIVSSFQDPLLEYGTSVQLMDYAGGNVRVIRPPPTIKVWCPGFVCCGQGEIYVVNEFVGNPVGIYRYTADGDYLGCVTTEVKNPSGVALSQDRMELFVPDHNQVKIFQRP